MKSKQIILLVVALILIGAGIFLVVQALTKSRAVVSEEFPVVKISNFAFSPSTLTINVGGKVVWTNMDSAPHTVVSDSGNEISSSSLSNGGTYSHTFNTAGTYDYHCSIHPSMKGTIVVG
ncbi:MAG: cupredoxin family copper-binding protein [Nanoarchaeota archaeon]|nr:cupredoxin family copper-binding protein [Nanoarchaeota archaeon]